jgi:hypothetical protein
METLRRRVQIIVWMLPSRDWHVSKPVESASHRT